jgi:hypothetical protein
MRIFLIILALSPLISIAQTPVYTAGKKAQKGFASMAVGFESIQTIGPGAGVHFSGNAEVDNGLFIGLGIGATKFKGMREPYVTFKANVSLTPTSYQGVKPMILFQPGYGATHFSTRVENGSVITRGGFTFFGGVGGLITGIDQYQPYFAVGVGHFGFTTEGKPHNYTGVSLRAGVLLR